MLKKSVVVLVILALAVALVAAGVAWNAASARAAAAVEQARADSTLQAVAVLHARTVDSLRQVAALQLVREEHAVEESERLRRWATAHATADADQEAVLAAATSAADSVPVLLSQRDDARSGYRLLLAADDSLRVALTAAQTRVTLAEAVRVADSTAAAAREEALRARNGELAVALAHARDAGGKLLGFLPRPRCVAGPTLSGQGPSWVGVTCGLAVL
jgi:hypothetical protein